MVMVGEGDVSQQCLYMLSGWAREACMHMPLVIALDRFAIARRGRTRADSTCLFVHMHVIGRAAVEHAYRSVPNIGGVSAETRVTVI